LHCFCENGEKWENSVMVRVSCQNGVSADRPVAPRRQLVTPIECRVAVEKYALAAATTSFDMHRRKTTPYQQNRRGGDGVDGRRGHVTRGGSARRSRYFRFVQRRRVLVFPVERRRGGRGARLDVVSVVVVAARRFVGQRPRRRANA